MFLYFFFQVVSGFEVTRRILVDLEGVSLRRKWLAGLEPENVHMMIGKLIAAECCLGGGNKYCSAFLSFLSTLNLNSVVAGSMTIDCLGILTELSDCKRKLFPVGYQ